MSLEVLRAHRREILELTARQSARHVRVFGSTVRVKAGPYSDTDLLVDIERGRTLLDVIAFEQDVEELLGCSVEVLTDAGLSPYLQQRILGEAAVL
jgi:predicted nucleotidyltransferase